jgi:hypothetical protein
MNTGFEIGSGNKASCFNGIVQVSYEWKENLFLNISFQYRDYKTANTNGQSNSNMLTAGFRLNMFKRNYDF